MRCASLHFFLCRQQRHAADFFEIQADGVVRINVGEVIIQVEVGFGFGGGFGGGQFFFRRIGERGVFDKGNARAQERREGFFQLLHILLGFGEEVQDVINGDVRLLPPQFDEARNGRVFFFLFDNQQRVIHVSLFLLCEIKIRILFFRVDCKTLKWFDNCQIRLARGCPGTASGQPAYGVGLACGVASGVAVCRKGGWLVSSMSESML